MSLDDGTVSAPKIAVTKASNPGLRCLMGESDAYMRGLYSKQEVYSVSEAGLNAPNCHCLLAYQDGEAAGCVILFDQLHYGEIKKLSVAKTYRRLGIRRSLIAETEALAGDIGLRELKLETGAALSAATAFYRAMDFKECPAFGTYPEVRSHLFMGKRLS